MRLPKSQTLDVIAAENERQMNEVYDLLDQGTSPLAVLKAFHAARFMELGMPEAEASAAAARMVGDFPLAWDVNRAFVAAFTMGYGAGRCQMFGTMGRAVARTERN